MASIENILNELIKYTGMPRSMVLELINEYFDGITTKLENLNNSINNNNKDDALMLTHNIKGTTSTLRMNSLASLFVLLEAAIRSEDQLNIYYLSNQIKISIDQYKDYLRYH